MLRRYVEQILSVFNYIDGVVVTNSKGIIEYYTNNRPDINKLREKDILGKHILKVYPDLTEETSSIYRVLRSGEPIYNEFQSMRSTTGQIINAVNTTIPIKVDDEIIGAVDISRWVDDGFQRKDIALALKDMKSETSLYTIDDIVTDSEKMKDMKEKIKRIAKTDSSVLIYGQTGTGKELFAQSIHTSGGRRSKRFVSQNCAAIPETLLEGILFGTTKGSYTGAENRPGLFEVASGGTIFLDEINSMELGVQAKILKVIEEKKVTRIGGLEPITIDVKVISAINEPPDYCVQKKKLREDLFYRLSVVRLDIPPLKERKEDVKLLTRYFIDSFNRKMNRDVMDVSEEVEKLFEYYSWPGNVREMKNVIEGAFNVISSRVIQVGDLPEYMIQSRSVLDAWEMEAGLSLQEMVAHYEKHIIKNTMDNSKNVTEAARKLKISKQGLSYKMIKYDLDIHKDVKEF